MISIKDEDHDRLREIVKLLTPTTREEKRQGRRRAGTVTSYPSCETTQFVKTIAETILNNIHELMQEKPHVRPMIAKGE